MSNVFDRLTNKAGYTGMYADKIVHPGHTDGEVNDFSHHNGTQFRRNLRGRSRMNMRRKATHEVTSSRESSHLRHRDEVAPMDTEGKIRYVFDYYCSFALGATDSRTELGSMNFMRFCQETPGLMARNLSRSDLDIIFTMAKSKHDTKLKYDTFLDALTAIALKKFPGQAQTTAFTLLLARHVFQNHVLANGKRPPKKQSPRRSPSKSPLKSPGRSAKSPAKPASPVRAEQVISKQSDKNPPLPSPTQASIAGSKAAQTPLPVAAPIASTIIADQSPLSLGIRVGAAAAPIKIALFVDLCCPLSKEMFSTVFREVHPALEAERHRGKVAWVVHHWTTPWVASGRSLAVHEVAVAVHRLARGKYLEFCMAVFNVQESFGTAALYEQSSKDIHAQAVDIAAGLGVDKDALWALLAPNSNSGENAVTNIIKASSMFAIQNGIRAAPTVTINGLVDFSPFYNWSSADWQSYLSSLM